MASLEIEIEYGSRIKTRAEPPVRIVIAEGHFRFGTTSAYALTRLDAGQLTPQCYEAWFDMTLDAMVRGDPVPMHDGGFSAFVAKVPRSEDWARFNATCHSWTLFLALHEAGHLWSKDSERLSRLGLLGKPVSEWSEEDLRFNRLVEMEADTQAIRWMVDAGVINVNALKGWMDWQLILDTVREVRTRGPIKRTHPTALERYENLLRAFDDTVVDDQSRTSLKHSYGELIERAKEISKYGSVFRVPELRNRPAAVTPWFERTAIRGTVLQSCTNGESPAVSLERYDPALGKQGR